MNKGKYPKCVNKMDDHNYQVDFQEPSEEQRVPSKMYISHKVTNQIAKWKLTGLNVMTLLTYKEYKHIGKSN